MRTLTLLLAGGLLLLGTACNRKEARGPVETEEKRMEATAEEPTKEERKEEKDKDKEERKQAEAEPLPEDVVKAWNKAGANVGWMGPRRPGQRDPFDECPYSFTRELDELDAKRAVPAFITQGPVRKGVLAKLPAPTKPFGFDTASCVFWGDAEIKELAALKNLSHLSLDCSRVTDGGLKELADLKNLTFLDLGHTEVTDAGLKQLAGLKSLSLLKLRGTKVTQEGIAELQKALPRCTIDK